MGKNFEELLLQFLTVRVYLKKSQGNVEKLYKEVMFAMFNIRKAVLMSLLTSYRSIFVS